MSEDNILVNGCPLCEIFINPEKNIRTKLYFPLSMEDINKNEFVIIECEHCKVPMMVLRDHIDYISPDIWRKSTYQCRRLFGRSIRFRTEMRKIHDHVHYHVIKVEF